MCRIVLTPPFQQLRNGQAFWDPAAPLSNFSTSLPDPLRIKPTGLQPHQAAVYEDFGTLVADISVQLFYHFVLMQLWTRNVLVLHQ